MRLKDKVTIVTGGANGIGRGIVEVFAREGAWVLVVDLEEAAGKEVVEGIRGRGGKAEFLRVDVSKEADVREAVKRAAGVNGGRVDAMVNNASYMGPWHDVMGVDDAEWEKTFRVAMMGTQYFTKAAMECMLPFKSGSIINISSVQGMVGARNSVSYTSIKHGLIGFTRSVAYDYGLQGIRANVICPGAIRTRVSAEPGSELHTRQISKTFLGKIGEPEDVAWAAVWLASDESKYVTGAVIPVDGGWTAM